MSEAETPPKVIGEMIGDNKDMLLSTIPFSVATGMEVVEVGPARATIRLPWRADLVGNPATGVLHGGIITALIDNACGCAVICALPRMTSIATLDLRIDYLRPATPGEAVIVEAECYRLTRNIAFIRALAHHGDRGDAIAHSVSTFMLGANKAPAKIVVNEEDGHGA